MRSNHARLLIAGLVLHLGTVAALAQHDEIERLEAATAVFEEIMDAPDEWIRVYSVSSAR